MFFPMAACLSKTLKLKRSLPCSFPSSSPRPLAASFSSNASPPTAAATDAAAAASYASQSQGWHFRLTFSALTSLIFSCFFFFLFQIVNFVLFFRERKREIVQSSALPSRRNYFRTWNLAALQKTGEGMRSRLCLCSSLPFLLSYKNVILIGFVLHPIVSDRIVGL